MCGGYFTALGVKASPAGHQLLHHLAACYAEPKLDPESRTSLMGALGDAAKAIGPESFLGELPIQIATSDGAPETAWLLSVLRGHVANASLGHFVRYFLPIQEWLLKRASSLEVEERSVEAKNLMNLFEQVWALLPGYCGCARDAADGFPPLAKALGAALNDQPQVRAPVLQALHVLIQQLRSQKTVAGGGGESGASGGGSEGTITVAVTAEARAGLEAMGRFAKNFLPLLFNIHQAEAVEKQQALGDSQTPQSRTLNHASLNHAPSITHPQ